MMVIERSARLRVSALLVAEGFTVVTAVETREAAEVIETFPLDGVVLEVDALRSEVAVTCGVLRAASPIPIAVLTGPFTERDAVDVFTAGADSVIGEPVGSHELVARVRALLRRAPLTPAEKLDELVVGPIVLDRARRELFVRGELVALPRREFDIAEFLMRAPGRVVTRQNIVRELWGSMRDTKSLDVQVGRLRNRLAAVEGWRRIETVRGVGFRFLGDDEIDLRDPEGLPSGRVSLSVAPPPGLEETAPA